jgi:dynein heavy chain
VTGQIIYGGRVTDYWDRRCLMTVLANFLNENVLEDGYKYSLSGIYTPAMKDELSLKSLQEKANNLPTVDSPEIFGMHENADIAF